ncbi:TPA: hypothetical protein ACH3X1_003983 [Trebouxia sp. C0004]
MHTADISNSGPSENEGLMQGQASPISLEVCQDDSCRRVPLAHACCHWHLGQAGQALLRTIALPPHVHCSLACAVSNLLSDIQYYSKLAPCTGHTFDTVSHQV